jgi:hypothetical protein
VTSVPSVAHASTAYNLVLRSARHPEARVPHLGRAPRRIARVSKDGHKRDRASGHPSRRSAREEARRAPQDEVCDDHAPPHFHVVGPDIDVQVAIETLQAIRGRFKGTALAEAMAWAAENRTLLLAKWSEFNERD